DKVVRVVVFRKGKTQTLKVTIGLLNETEAAAAQPAAEAGTELAGLGLTLAPLTDEGRSQFGLAEDVTGVLVTAVAAGSGAAEKGISPGDVIVEVGQEPVTTPAEVQAGIEAAVAAGRESVLLLIQSGADVRFVPLPLGN
ncbi:MAG TPA: PDZ domain-containing protein, partial [Thermohalobaculum sp.]|nr:PDZ domain-containing protein [Thermohalobaculum sp.]